MDVDHRTLVFFVEAELHFSDQAIEVGNVPILDRHPRLEQPRNLVGIGHREQLVGDRKDASAGLNASHRARDDRRCFAQLEHAADEQRAEMSEGSARLDGRGVKLEFGEGGKADSKRDGVEGDRSGVVALEAKEVHPGKLTEVGDLVQRENLDGVLDRLVGRALERHAVELAAFEDYRAAAF